MEQNENTFILQSDDSYIIQSKKIYKSPVQISDLEQLNWHISRMYIPESNIDYFSLFSGAALTSIPNLYMTQLRVSFLICIFSFVLHSSLLHAFHITVNT